LCGNDNCGANSITILKKGVALPAYRQAGAATLLRSPCLPAGRRRGAPLHSVIPVKLVLDLIGERESRTKKMKPGFLLPQE